MRPALRILVATLPMLLACSLASGELPSAAPATRAATASVTPPTALAPALPPEAIQILEPGPGSRLVSPMTVRVQTTRPAFEQTLTLRVLSDDGRELIAPQAIAASQAEGGRLTFNAALTFSVTEERHAFLQAYLTSPRDGGVTHLASTWMRLMPDGAVHIEPAEVDPAEQLHLVLPEAGARLTGGSVHVEGVGLASFEQTLLIEVHDVAGNIIGLQPVLVQAPDWGVAGPFAAEVAYTLTEAGPGRIVVRDLSPAHGDDVHRASVEVELAP